MVAFDHVGKKASAEWLTSLLTKNGFLRSGEVVEVNQRPSRIGTTLTAEFILLQMRYSPDHTGNPPAAAVGEARSEVLPSFFDEMGDGLSRARRATFEQLSDRYPRLLNAHAAATQRQTLAHGDTHFWNVLYPNDPTASPVLIDWQGCLVQFGAWDLTYMIGLQFDLEHRRHRESSLLDAYLLTLHERGIDYRHDDLLYDYRLMIAGLLFAPIVQRSNGVPTQVWRHYFEHAISAFEDLDCRSFLD